MRARLLEMASGLVDVLNQVQIGACRSLSSGRAIPPLRIARSIDHPRRGFTDGRHASESEDSPFEPAHSVCSEVPSVDQRRHTHCDDEPRRPSRKQPPRMAGSLSIAFGLPSRPLRRNRNPFFWTAGHPARAGEIRPQPVWAAGVGRVLTSRESPSLCCSFVRTP
jgi:hypothetical protein